MMAACLGHSCMPFVCTRAQVFTTPHPCPAALPAVQAKRPLSVMRTLGTMLLPRLQPGEPDRDFAQGQSAGFSFDACVGQGAQGGHSAG